MSVLSSVFFLYADPGAGALLLQMLMAVLFGGLFFFRTIKDKVLGLFGKGSASVAEIEPEEVKSSESSEVSTK